jgi:ABC-2 type transport system ATP-binding protein
MSRILVDHVSRWYGNVVAVNDVTLEIGAGITGLLGPNGAGKSTLINMIAGFLAPSAGSITLDGVPTWRNEQVYRHIGLVPEREELFDSVTGWQFVLANAQLHGLPDPGAAAERALATVDLLDAKDRAVGGYSKGMRQRVKMATAIVHEPAVLLLDEPFNGMDPRQRLHLMDLLRRLADEGTAILFSSHILEDVEELADSIEVLVSGRHAASGDFRAIRRLMVQRPLRYTVETDSARALAAALIADPSVSAASIAGETTLELETIDHDAFVAALPRLARERSARLWSVSPADESLEDVFSYLVER